MWVVVLSTDHSYSSPGLAWARALACASAAWALMSGAPGVVVVACDEVVVCCTSCAMAKPCDQSPPPCFQTWGQRACGED